MRSATLRVLIPIVSIVSALLSTTYVDEPEAVPSRWPARELQGECHGERAEPAGLLTRQLQLNQSLRGINVRDSETADLTGAWPTVPGDMLTAAFLPTRREHSTERANVRGRRGG